MYIPHPLMGAIYGSRYFIVLTLIFISYKACVTMMTATTRCRCRRSAYMLDEERTSHAANLAAVIACSAIRRRLLQRRMRRNRGSAPGRLPFRRRHRKSVWDVYNEVGELNFRRAYRMTFATFTRVATILRPYIIAASGKSGTPRFSRPPMDQSLGCPACLCNSLVCRWVVL